MKGIIDNECAGQNALMRLATSHFTNATESKLAQDSLRHQLQHHPQPSTEESLINEYLTMNSMMMGQQAPRTFHMGALFNELKQIDNNTNKESVNLSESLTKNASIISQQNNQDWSQEYFSFNNKKSAGFGLKTGDNQFTTGVQTSPLINTPQDGFKWSTEYLSQNEATIFDEAAWENLLFKSSNQTAPTTTPTTNTQIVQNSDQQNKLNDEMLKTANELLDSMQDNRFSETEFMQFVRELSIKDSKTNNNPVNNEEIALDWVNEFQKQQHLQQKQQDTKDAYWSDLEDEWTSMLGNQSNGNANQSHPWLDEFQKVFDTYKTYEFDQENPLLAHENPFEEGMERLKMHDIVNAVLLFEVAVQKDPKNMLAWQYLGNTQVENEQDAQAIRALRRCLDLKPDNLIALSTLATSYTNESMQRMAFDSLLKWLNANPKYSHLLRNGDAQAERLLRDSEMFNQSSATSFLSNIVDINDFMDLQEVFLKAVRESSISSTTSKESYINNSGKIDPDLQCCLGVLFHLSSEYDKAADCFKTALLMRPNDHLLWNKLGATYANNNRNEEAIDAYFQALKLCPGFVRARYNLGIGCMNLGAYK